MYRCLIQRDRVKKKSWFQRNDKEIKETPCKVCYGCWEETEETVDENRDKDSQITNKQRASDGQLP